MKGRHSFVMALCLALLCGSSNEKTGTTPDLVSAGGENPLVTALRAIQTQKGIEP